MIEKIVRIQNVAKFHDYKCKGDVELRPLSLIYAENGKGKSSIAAILRSLATNDPSHITAKSTIGSSQPQHIQIKHADGMAEFKNQVWNQALPYLIIFDSFYVNTNVFSGDRVDHTHKKNLYYLLIGEQSVKLAKEIDQLDTRARELGPQKKEISGDIVRHINGDLDLQSFLELKKVDDIDAQIQNQEFLIASLKKSLEIQETTSLSSILLPVFDIAQFEKRLQMTIETITGDAEEKFKHHCQSLGERGENWIKEGVDFSRRTANCCPFCGQLLDKSSLVKVYSDYFNEAYLKLKDDINQSLAYLDEYFSPDILMQIQAQIEKNNSRSAFWQQYIPEKYPDMEFSNIKKVLDELFLEAKSCLVKKAGAPIEKCSVSPSLRQAVECFTSLNGAADNYNSQVEHLNILIERKKKDIGRLSIDEENTRLAFLQNIKLRYDPKILEICNTYLAILDEEAKVNSEKEIKRDQLKSLTDELINKYQKSLNDLLVNFGTDFRIQETKTSFLGGRPSASYCLLINGECISLGTEETLDKPGFKTTLSDGEKNTLAFAFFLAQLQQDPELNRKVVVIDDPITSLDENRRVCTKQEIKKIVGVAKQVIVLSHDPHFLKGIGEDYKSPKTLWIKRSGQASVIEEWDINVATQSPYNKDYSKLVQYINCCEGDPRDVVRCIRPVLEGYLRVRFPEEFQPSEWLGQFIEKTSSAKDDEHLAKVKNRLEELANINDFSKGFHHQTDPNATANLNNITDGQLSPWVKRTLELIRVF